MAPEMVQNKVHDAKIDIWSVGVLLYELVHGYPPFRGKSTDQKFSEILNNNFKISDDCSAECKDLILKLLRQNPDERPTFDEIFTHPWVKGFEGTFKMKISDYIYNPNKKKRKQSKQNNSTSITEVDSTPRSQMSQSVSESMMNDTMNASFLDTSVVNFEPLSIKAAGDASFMEGDTSPMMKTGNSSPTKVQRNRKVAAGGQSGSKSPATRPNKFKESSIGQKVLSKSSNAEVASFQQVVNDIKPESLKDLERSENVEKQAVQDDEIPDESNKKGVEPRKSDISEKQTRNSKSPARNTANLKAEERVSLISERVTQTERITNIEKYIQNYLEDNEELQVLSKLEIMSTPSQNQKPIVKKKGIFEKEDISPKLQKEMKEDLMSTGNPEKTVSYANESFEKAETSFSKDTGACSKHHGGHLEDTEELHVLDKLEMMSDPTANQKLLGTKKGIFEQEEGEESLVKLNNQVNECRAKATKTDEPEKHLDAYLEDTEEFQVLTKLEIMSTLTANQKPIEKKKAISEEAEDNFTNLQKQVTESSTNITKPVETEKKAERVEKQECEAAKEITKKPLQSYKEYSDELQMLDKLEIMSTPTANQKPLGKKKVIFEEDSLTKPQNQMNEDPKKSSRPEKTVDQANEHIETVEAPKETASKQETKLDLKHHHSSKVSVESNPLESARFKETMNPEEELGLCKHARTDSPTKAHDESNEEETRLFSFGKKHLEEANHIANQIKLEASNDRNKGAKAEGTPKSPIANNESSSLRKMKVATDNSSGQWISGQNQSSFDTAITQGSESRRNKEIQKKKKTLKSEVKTDSSSDEEGGKYAKKPMQNIGRGNNTTRADKKTSDQKENRAAEISNSYLSGSRTPKDLNSNNSFMVAAEPKADKAKTPRPVEKKESSKFSDLSKKSNVQVREQEHQKKDLSREDLLKFYQKEMNKLESSMIGTEIQEENEASHQIDSNQAMGAIRNRLQAKKTKEPLGIYILLLQYFYISYLEGNAKKIGETSVNGISNFKDRTAKYTIHPEVLEDPDKIQEWLVPRKNKPQKEYAFSMVDGLSLLFCS